MRHIRSVLAMTEWSAALSREGVGIGLVPTMGALHAGHRSLIRRARLACDALVVSLFVNPLQFGPHEDYGRYPRSFEADAKLCREEGVDVLFAPEAKALYPSGFQTSVTVGPLGRRWEGAARPGHFDGVATVVAKLFALIQPDQAFFGQKDFQQTVVVQRLVEDLNLSPRIVLCPTIREHDGLALSSRNRYLTQAQRKVAPILHEALQAGRRSILKGARVGTQVTRAMRQAIAGTPGVTVNYLAICDPNTLEPQSRVGRAAVLLGAVRLGRVRLIDNLVVKR